MGHKATYRLNAPKGHVADPRLCIHALANPTAHLLVDSVYRRGRSVILGYRNFCIFEADNWQPDDLTDFGFRMDFYVGDDDGSDAFTVLVCSPSWFTRERGGEVVSGRNVIFMPRFDRTALDDFLKAQCAEECGKSVETAMLKIDGIGEWEYRYRS